VNSRLSARNLPGGPRCWRVRFRSALRMEAARDGGVFQGPVPPRRRRLTAAGRPDRGEGAESSAKLLGWFPTKNWRPSSLQRRPWRPQAGAGHAPGLAQPASPARQTDGYHLCADTQCRSMRPARPARLCWPFQGHPGPGRAQALGTNRFTRVSRHQMAHLARFARGLERRGPRPLLQARPDGHERPLPSKRFDRPSARGATRCCPDSEAEGGSAYAPDHLRFRGNEGPHCAQWP